MRGFTPRPALIMLAGVLTLTLLSGPEVAMPASAAPAGPHAAVPAPRGAPPGIDPAYIYSQLDYLVTHFQRREAGYVAGSAGHAGFARYWRRQMLGLLGGFGARARDYPFPVRGWLGRPATAPAVDLEVTVPGLADPSREVIIGCHYDGEADSTQSANDDASGCAIELGVAQAMASYWRSHDVGPARTLRFVLFDAEEQGIFGSYDYVNRIARGDLRSMSAMINEEQNGIAYPLRYLGSSANPLLPLFAYVSPLAANGIYPRSPTTPRQRAALAQLRALVRRAVPASFRQFRAMGDQMLTYHRRAGPDVWRPIFTPAQAGSVRVLGDTIGSSDQVPFTTAGVRTAMFVGNSTYYQRHPPPGSYPYDRPQDTIALMNTFADGGSAASHALELALGLPGMLTTWLLSQPALLGQARPGRGPAAAIGDVGVVLPGHPVTFDAAASYDPGRPGARLRYAWSFGDGRSASGLRVRHAYAAAGSYPLRLTVSSGPGRVRVITRQVRVGRQAVIANPYGSPPSSAAGTIGNLVARGLPPANPAALRPAPAAGLRDRVGTAALARRLTARAVRAGQAGRGAAAPGRASAAAWVIAAAGGAVLLAIGLIAWRRARRRKAGATAE